MRTRACAPTPVCAGTARSRSPGTTLPEGRGDEGTSKATRVSYKSPGLRALPAPPLLERVGAQLDLSSRSFNLQTQSSTGSQPQLNLLERVLDILAQAQRRVHCGASGPRTARAHDPCVPPGTQPAGPLPACAPERPGRLQTPEWAGTVQSHGAICVKVAAQMGHTDAHACSGKSRWNVGADGPPPGLLPPTGVDRTGPTTRPRKVTPAPGPGSEAKRGLEGSEPPRNAPQGHPSERTPAQERAPRAERPGRSLPHGGEGKFGMLALSIYWPFEGFCSLWISHINGDVYKYCGKASFLWIEVFPGAWLSSPGSTHGSRALSPGPPRPLSGPLAPLHCDLPSPPAGEGFLWSGSWCPPEYVTAVRSFPSDGAFWRLGKCSLASSNDPGGSSKQQAGPLRAADPANRPSGVSHQALWSGTDCPSQTTDPRASSARPSWESVHLRTSVWSFPFGEGESQTQPTATSAAHARAQRRPESGNQGRRPAVPTGDRAGHSGIDTHVILLSIIFF